MNTKLKQTHENFITSVASLAIAKLAAPEERAACEACKLVYGSGPAGTRGVTYFQKWKRNGGAEIVPFVEVCAFGQEGPVQLAGTTIHELAHVLAGWQAGHGPAWKAACERLGLRRVQAAGTDYKLAMFAPDLRAAISAIELPNEGAPSLGVLGTMGVTMKPCGAGLGTKGGKSRGKGSGSRLRLFECECVPPVKLRAARDTLNCTCNDCLTIFQCKA